MDDVMPGAVPAPVAEPDIPDSPVAVRPDPPVAVGSGEAAAPEEPAPLGVVIAPTGDPRVDAALERLADADHLPAEGHPEVYEDVHRELREALDALDAPPGSVPAPLGPAPSPPYDLRS
ncbi:hypothetical protein ABT354_23940 [Streptomyces sp. NPDC000594]|uniref:hypothetical protein n=1 Tax=Streptomyces sp. NPDC000594 TaxID=3154261 RepID=UPI00331C4922